MDSPIRHQKNTTKKGTQMPEHEHTPECGNTRACMEHDTEEHWIDDYAYAVPIPDSANHSFQDMIDLLTKAERHDEDMRVARFALVVVDGHGKLDVLSYPTANSMALINLLTRGASLIAFQEHQAMIEQQHAMHEAMAAAFTGAFPFPRFMPPNTDGDDPDYNGGNLYP